MSSYSPEVNKTKRERESFYDQRQDIIKTLIASSAYDYSYR